MRDRADETMLGAAVFFLTTALAQAGPADRVFTDAEARAIQAYWAAPGRYEIGEPPNAAREGRWAVRLTPEGSTWLHAVLRARGGPKVPPGQTAPPLTPQQRAWEEWIDRRVAEDRWQATLDARRRNESEGGPALPLIDFAQAPRAAGAMPEDLRAAVGAPPPLAAAVRPQAYTVRFDDGWEARYVDQPPMRPRFAYYRFGEGVMSGGRSVRTIPDAELQDLFRRAGLDGSLLRILQSVSLLEGGFDSVNTYDTGFVSVGVIQFAALSGGAGSLGRVLLRTKRDDPAAFQADFRRFGVDVTREGRLAVIDPATGTEHHGPEANQAIIRDKRLTAVFPRAGQRSRPFQVAQLRVAVDEYYPGDDQVTVFVDGQTMTARVDQIFRSEAGLATLMDRKVNTGRLDPLPEVLSRAVREFGVRTLSALAEFEHQLIGLIRYRKDYLADATLRGPRAGAGPAPSRDGGARANPRPAPGTNPTSVPTPPPPVETAPPDRGDGVRLGDPPKGDPPRPTVAPHPRVEPPTGGPVDDPTG